MHSDGRTLIRLNLSNKFHNKVNLTGDKSAFSFSFYPVEVSLTQLTSHIVKGGAFTVGHFQDNRRVSTRFVSSQLLALDLDQCPLTIDDLEAIPEIYESVYLMYPTPSSTPENPKTRILFVLDEPIEGQHSAMRWRVLQVALMDAFSHLMPDGQCKDPARLFYGSETRQYYVNYLARLSVEAAANRIIPQAEREYFARTESQYIVTRQLDNTDELTRLVNRWFDTAIQRVSSTPKGNRHKTFINYAMWLYGLNKGNWPITTDEIERAFTSIAIGWGSTQNEAEASLKWAWENSTAIDREERKVSERGRRVGLQQRVSKWGKSAS